MDSRLEPRGACADARLARNNPLASTVGFLMLLLSLILAATVQTKDPALLFAQERLAAGGAAWNRVAEIVERGNFLGQGLSGTYTDYVDTRTGFSSTVLKLESGPRGQGYDARGPWSYDDGLLDALGDTASVQSGRTMAFIARNGWWNPRDPAQMTYSGTRSGSRSYDVVHIVPAGGSPMDVWLDAATHLIAKIEVTDSSNVTTTIRYFRYRRVSGVVYPFASTTGTGNARNDNYSTVTAVVLRPRIVAADFTRPANLRLGSIAGGISTSVPFDLDSSEKGHIVVLASINGSRPLHFVFDTGGSAIVTPEVASEIGLHGKGQVVAGGAGEAQVTAQIASGATLRLGAATLRNQEVGIIAMPPSLVENTGKYRTDGIIGYEMLKNFVITVDYVNRRMTLTNPESFSAEGRGTAIRFDSATIPIIAARLNGVDGRFMLDTGNAFFNTISNDFLAKNGLNPPGDRAVLVQSSGNLGGALRTPLWRASKLSIGPYQLDAPVFAVTQTRKGALAGTTFAGNIGEPILSRFDLTFDYAHNTIYFKPNANFNRPFTGSLDGMSVYKPSPDALEVSYVNPGSPAALAGIASGDRIVSIDGSPAARLGPADVQTLESGKNTLDVVFTHQGAIVEKTITLSEQLQIP